MQFPYFNNIYQQNQQNNNNNSQNYLMTQYPIDNDLRHAKTSQNFYIQNQQ